MKKQMIKQLLATAVARTLTLAKRHNNSLAIGACLAGSILIIHNAHATPLGDIFVIDLENTDWTQPDGNVAVITSGTSSGGTVGSAGAQQQIYGNAAAPYINSLVTPGN